VTGIPRFTTGQVIWRQQLAKAGSSEHERRNPVPRSVRCENELGFTQVKWIRAIEFVDDFSRIGSGEGDYNEDHEFYGYKMPI